MVLDAFEHRDAPFDQLVRALNPERLPGRDPIFEVMLNFLNESGVLPSAHDLMVSLPRDRDVDALRALTLYVHESPDSLKLPRLSAGLFSTERMSVLMEQYVHLLEQAVRDADRPLASYSLVTPAPRSCYRICAGRFPPLRSSRSRQASQRGPSGPAGPRDPLAGANLFGYGDLMSRALQRAHALRAQGVRTGDVVAVQGPRSFRHGGEPVWRAPGGRDDAPRGAKPAERPPRGDAVRRAGARRSCGRGCRSPGL